MKKKFEKPQVKRIELNLKENIVASGSFGYHFNEEMSICTYETTNMKFMEIFVLHGGLEGLDYYPQCIRTGKTRSVGRNYSLEELMGYL